MNWPRICGYREVKHPRRWFPGMRCIGVRPPNGQQYKKAYGNMTYMERWLQPHELPRKLFPGVLLKNEWGFPQFPNPRYTIRCDDGKIRKFQVIKEEA